MEKCCNECGNNDGPLFLHGRCHPNSPSWASVKGDEITVECAQCGKLVAKFQLAKDAVH